jgi:AraC-like DNA-binding protein
VCTNACGIRREHTSAIPSDIDSRAAEPPKASGIYQPNVPGARQICDGAAMAAFSLVCELAGQGSASSLKVLLSRSTPGNVVPYRRSFGVKLAFDAEQTAVVIPLDMLDQSVPGADARRRVILEKRIKTLSHAGDLDVLTQLRRRLRVGLVKGGVSAIGMASQVGMTRRTLNRRLDVAGVRFQDVLDETRLGFVQQLLSNTQLSIRKIAAVVGYSNASALTRSFTRWTGMTPSQWRTKSNLKGSPGEGPSRPTSMRR